MRRFQKVPPGIYLNHETGKPLIIISDDEYHIGSTCIRKGKYKYARWREGDKIKEKYLEITYPQNNRGDR
ncbi:unnamed protein product [marine sediment metagenome]|uniref:Uncharacterized protein n=1 Tax=marine sediment metagenome TaxID=412755 RepID=X1KTC0_9ZZZZ